MRAGKPAREATVSLSFRQPAAAASDVERYKLRAISGAWMRRWWSGDGRKMCSVVVAIWSKSRQHERDMDDVMDILDGL